MQSALQMPYSNYNARHCTLGWPSPQIIESQVQHLQRWHLPPVCRNGLGELIVVQAELLTLSQAAKRWQRASEVIASLQEHKYTELCTGAALLKAQHAYRSSNGRCGMARAAMQPGPAAAGAC